MKVLSEKRLFLLMYRLKMDLGFCSRKNYFILYGVMITGFGMLNGFYWSNCKKFSFNWKVDSKLVYSLKYSIPWRKKQNDSNGLLIDMWFWINENVILSSLTFIVLIWYSSSSSSSISLYPNLLETSSIMMYFFLSSNSTLASQCTVPLIPPMNISKDSRCKKFKSSGRIVISIGWREF